jgi:POT family proton-dependent oligopeptide transporter
LSPRAEADLAVRRRLDPLMNCEDQMARTSSLESTPTLAEKIPKSVGHIIGAEFAERISYYAIQAILVIFMTTRMRARNGSPDPMAESEAIAFYHWFVSFSMLLPLFGALLADALWGKYRTILILSIFYSFGHAALAIDETRFGLLVGLGLIALGAGGLKACVPAILGDQFTPRQGKLLSRVYSLYFWALNLGSFVATLATPLLLEHYGPRVAFGLPCMLMTASTVMFWLGRKRYLIVPPTGLKNAEAIFSWRSLVELRVLTVISLLIVPPVGVLFITNSAMVLQAAHLDLNWAGITWLPSQVFVFNPLFSLAFIPLLSLVIFPAIDRYVRLSPLRKMGMGFVMTMLGVLVLIWLQMRIDADEHPSVVWHVLVIGIFVTAELLIHIPAVEFAYAIAPPRLRSVAMSFRSLTMSFGNAFVALTTGIVGSAAGALPGLTYYLFFLGSVAVSGAAFLLYSARLPQISASNPELLDDGGQQTH